MCGIVGYLKPPSSATNYHTVIRSMTNSLSHRGPDSSGFWLDPSLGVSLGHRRLSINDLSPSGSQPMVSPCSRYVIAFNGEIYNWRDLRSKLCIPQTEWNSNTDTEVILRALSSWGISKFLSRARGMFAIAIWDRSLHELLLIRDRIGEKPLYYGLLGNTFFFSSELKAVHHVPDCPTRLDPASLSLMIRHGYIPSPRTIYQDIFKLPAGCLLRYSIGQGLAHAEPWWSLSDLVQTTPIDHTRSDEDAIFELQTLLGSVLAEQTQADVPAGAFLSGGIDSTVIAALMQQQSPTPVRTFTVGFSDQHYNESDHAASIAKHLGTDHTTIYSSPTDLLNLIQLLPYTYDEPFGDSSQLPTLLLSQETRRHVTIALSGDAGDELFAGYNRYIYSNLVHSLTTSMPSAFRRPLSTFIHETSSERINRLYNCLAPLLPRSFRLSNPGAQLHKLATLLSCSSLADIYSILISQWHGPSPVNPICAPTFFADEPHLWPSKLSSTQQLMFVDTLTYLPDDILVKVDRAAMSVGLETRVPFLDPRVLSFAWSLPPHQQIRNNQGKWALRNLAHKYVPPQLLDRPKQGFAVPIEHWLRGPLRDWASDLLSPEFLSADGLLDPQPILKLWHSHLSGRNHQHALWNILMFQAWRQHWR